MTKQVYVTVLSTDDYLPGVLALNKSINELCSFPLLVLTSGTLGNETYEHLERRKIRFVRVDDVEVPDDLVQATKDHAWYSHWVKSFLKLRVFDLPGYDKIVAIDCDMMLMESIDEVFALPDMSAVIAGRSYPGNERWVDLNSGLMVIVPREGLSEQIAGVIPEVNATKSVFGDQDLIQAFFSGWRDNAELHMPEGYNVHFSHYGHYHGAETVKVVHFVGRDKPWMMSITDICRQYVKCFAKGNIAGIPVLRKYLKLLRAAAADE